MLIRFTIFCNSSTHQEEEHDVETLLFAPNEEGSFEWTTPVGGLRVDDRRILPGDVGFWGQGDGSVARWRREFRCDLCGDSLAVRDEKFRPRVERLFSHGVSRVSLAGLRGTL